MHLQIILGSVRGPRVSAPVGRWAAGVAREALPGWTIEVVDLAAWDLPLDLLQKSPSSNPPEERLHRAWARSAARADAYLVVCPEYNHGYTAPLKNGFDLLQKEWGGKPAALLSYGGAAGARSLEQFRLVLLELRLVPLRQAMQLRDVWGRIEGGTFSGEEREGERLGTILKELASWAETLSGSPAGPRGGGEAKEGPPEGRVLVLGLKKEVNDAVVGELQAAGVAAEGSVELDGIAERVEPGRFELVVFGRGALGDTADAIRDRLRERDPALRFLDVISPVAVRQTLAALKPDGPDALEGFEARVDGGSLRASGTVARTCRLRLVLYRREGDGVSAERIAALRPGAGPLDLALPLDGAGGAHSLVADVDGTEFHHVALA